MDIIEFETDVVPAVGMIRQVFLPHNRPLPSSYVEPRLPVLPLVPLQLRGGLVFDRDALLGLGSCQHVGMNKVLIASKGEGAQIRV